MKRGRNHDGVTKEGVSALKVGEVREIFQREMSLNKASKQVLTEESRDRDSQRHKCTEGGGAEQAAGRSRRPRSSLHLYVPMHPCVQGCRDVIYSEQSKWVKHPQDSIEPKKDSHNNLIYISKVIKL